jgi:hypothetical protein
MNWMQIFHERFSFEVLQGASPSLYLRLAAQCFIMSSDAFLELSFKQKQVVM